LESNEGRRVGDTDSYRTDVRVIAATNRDLRQDVAGKRFRQDLFYRLATFELTLPSLRDIPADIPAIADHLLRSTSVPGALARCFSPAALAALREYLWPGNVRELRNIIERAKILCDQEEVRPEHLNFPLMAQSSEELLSIPQGTIAEVECRMIRDALRRNGQNKTAAAKSLGISLRTLYNKLEARGENAPAAEGGA
jgi:DNA-binding NtrC family response regulator